MRGIPGSATSVQYLRYTAPELAYEVECVDPMTGETLWLSAMFPDELEVDAP